MAALALLALAPAALAAVPDNDDFADREVLTGSLPIEVTRSNVEATKEEGEFIPGLSPAGHSVWFEWKAEEDGWVTIGACDNEFPTVLAVLTGTELAALTPAAGGNGSEGPDCPYMGRQYTFKAKSGTKYVIAVDGNNFHFPEGPLPITEGEIMLRIEATATPPNDDFADARVIAGSISEEPGGDRFYFANARGFNWTATTEAGEPEAASSGASVWYSFTAPEEATYRFGSPCCQTAFSLHRDLYLGDSLAALTPLSLGGLAAEAHLAAGTTVRIRVSGPIDPESEEPAVANFDFNISAELAPLPAKPSPEGGGTNPPPPDTAAPETRIFRMYRMLKPPRFVGFRFKSSEAGSTFRCSLDRQPFQPCAARRSFRRPLPGPHKLRVAAVDPAGNIDPTPAVGRFRFPPRHHR